MHEDRSTADPRRILAAGALVLLVLVVVANAAPWVLGGIVVAAVVVALVDSAPRGWSAPHTAARLYPREQAPTVVVIETGDVTVSVYSAAPRRSAVGHQLTDPDHGWVRLPGEDDAWLLDDGEG